MGYVLERGLIPLIYLGHNFTIKDGICSREKDDQLIQYLYLPTTFSAIEMRYEIECRLTGSSIAFVASLPPIKVGHMIEWRLAGLSLTSGPSFHPIEMDSREETD